MVLSTENLSFHWASDEGGKVKKAEIESHSVLETILYSNILYVYIY